MCGVFTESGKHHSQHQIEWNALLDPHAAAIVYQQAPKANCSFGLDVTTQVKIRKDEAKARFQSDLLKPVLDFANVWFEHSPVITFHDPLAGASIFRKTICQYQTGSVEIEVYDEQGLGKSKWNPNDASNSHKVAVAVDPSEFFSEFFSVFE